MKLHWLLLFSLSALALLLVSCRPETASSPLDAATSTRAQHPTNTSASTHTQSPSKTPTATQNPMYARSTETAARSFLLTETALAPTSSPRYTATSKPSFKVPPLYGSLQTTWLQSGSKAQLFLLPDLSQGTPYTPGDPHWMSTINWDIGNKRFNDFQKSNVKVDGGEGVSTCSIWKDGGWKEVLRVNENQISLLAESITGRQQVWIQDCALSPDGDVVAVNILGGGTQWYDRSVIYTLNVDGSNFSRRTPSVFETVYMALEFHPYEPVFFYHDSAGGGAWAYNVRTGQRWRLTGELKYYDFEYDISPDGRWFAYLEDQYIYFTDFMEGGKPHKISTGEDRLYSISWSPSGNHILGIMNSGGDNFARVYEVLFDQPDGKIYSFAPVTKPIALGRESLIWIPWVGKAAERYVCGGAVSSYLAPGDYAYGNPDLGGPFRVRKEAGTTPEILETILKHERVIVLSGPTCLDGRAWWKVYVQKSGNEGWMMESDGGQRYLLPLIPPEGRHYEVADDGEPAPTPASTTATITPGATAISACPGAPPTQLGVGMRAMVSKDTTTPNRIRTEPSTSGEQVGQFYPGTVMDIIGGPACANNFMWWQVSATVESKLVTGWTVEGDTDRYWLIPVK